MTKKPSWWERFTAWVAGVFLIDLAQEDRPVPKPPPRTSPTYDGGDAWDGGEHYDGTVQDREPKKP